MDPIILFVLAAIVAFGLGYAFSLWKEPKAEGAVKVRQMLLIGIWIGAASLIGYAGYPIIGQFAWLLACVPLFFVWRQVRRWESDDA